MSNRRAVMKRGEYLDVTGQRFGKWTAVRFAGRKARTDGSQPRAYWLCRCDCGAEREVCIGGLRSGVSRSCGTCSARPGNTVHGETGTPLWNAWQHIRRDMVAEWSNYLAFKHAVGDKPDGMCLRKLREGEPYGPDNWTWGKIGRRPDNTGSNQMICRIVELMRDVDGLVPDGTADRLVGVSKQRRHQILNNYLGKLKRRDIEMIALEGPISRMLRAKLNESSGETLLCIEREVGIPLSAIRRFAIGEGGLSMRYADMLAGHFNLELREADR